MNIGNGYKQGLEKQSVEFDANLVAQGVKDAMSGAKTRLTDDEAKTVLTEVQTEVNKQRQEKMQEASAKNKAEGEAFLAANKSKEGVVTLPSGLQYKILTAGIGPKPTANDRWFVITAARSSMARNLTAPTSAGSRRRLESVK